MASSQEKTLAVSKNKSKVNGIFVPIVISKLVPVNITNVGRNIQKTLETIIAKEIEGKCCDEGYVKDNSVKLQTFSSGMIQADNVHYQVIFECMVCNPVEGMEIDCIAKNITKAGIRAELDEPVSPIVVFIARDHHDIDEYFTSVKENDNIRIKVIGQRYELNDKYISIIADLLPPVQKVIVKKSRKPKLNIS